MSEMKDQFSDRLSEYLDGDLPADVRAEVEGHLAGCFECQRTLGELREVVARARSMSDAPPARDLWAGIASHIGKRPLQLTDLQANQPVKQQRRFAFTMSQLAAAAILLMMVSGGLVWGMMGQRGRAAVATAAPAAADVRPVSTAAADLNLYSDAVSQLEATLRTQRGQLDPVTVAIVEENLRAIDHAITEARAALGQDPGNLYLNQHLENTMMRKIHLLRRANSLGSARI